MKKPKEQMKFTVDSGTASAFRARCAAEGVSMASVISGWMESGRPAKAATPKTDTRQHRRKAALDAAALLDDVLRAEEGYRDGIPEQFQSRYDAADHACEQLAEAISCLEDAF